MSADIQEAKRRLPLKDLMTLLGFGDRAKKSARCCFHDDHNPSFGIFEKDGQWFFKCHACGVKGDSIDFLAQAKGIDVKEATKLFLEMAGVGGQTRLTASAPAQAAPAKSAATETPTVVTPRPLGEILDTVAGLLRRWVVFPLPEQVSVVAAWVVHSWVFEAFDYTAYLFVFSAAKRSGKSRVLEVIEQLAKNPRLASGASAAALTRIGDESNPPCMLLDEVDTIYGKGNKGDGTEAENIRRFLNAGYRRGAKFLKCAGQGADINVKELPAFCPKALAAIDRCLPDTVLDRSLPIELVRQSRGEKAERFREREVRAVVAPVRAELEALAQQPGLLDALRDSRPTLPEELNDRVMDITEPLVAIADLAGGEWPERIRSALIKIYSQEEDADIGVKLLAAIKGIFDKTGADKATTEEILKALVAVEDGPWAIMFEDALKHDRLQTAASKLARLLKRYKRPDGEKIKPRSIKLSDGSVSRGYHKTDFCAEWGRYLPSLPEKAATSATSATCEGKTVAAADSGSATGLPGATENTREGSGSSGSSASTEKGRLDAMTAGEYEEWFNQTKQIYPGDWIRLYSDETVEHWQTTLKQALEKPCEVCGEPMGDEERFWFHRARRVGRCPGCQEADWWADGYEISDGLPSCWSHKHTREERIAERTRNLIGDAASYWARNEGIEYDAAYQALLARQPEEIRHSIEQLSE